ncbi:MAG: P-loop containing nucleoside triphosphate hydrolase protein [Piptocephalis tieghemiana]|nr:MAG: P-loop containing nucleoside triphosphate hydrolase protein [Piptocephalis tieghemiana]
MASEVNLGSALLALAHRRTEAVSPPKEDDPASYPDGSILQLILHHFVTYDHCVFRPGPRLNLVIGPNGTGKSTLMCGMILGLGGKPDILGRARDIADFIKHGHESGWVEVTLRSSSSSSGHVRIRRNIRFNPERTSGLSTWQINGQPSTLRKVVGLTKKLGIHVDNLCQFLPQDRVASFALLNPVQLLMETEKVAGRSGSGVDESTLLTEDEEDEGEARQGEEGQEAEDESEKGEGKEEEDLVSMHERLLALGRSKRSLVSKLTGDSEALKHAVSRRDGLAREMERWREAEASQRRAKLFALKIPFLEYAAAREEFKEAVTEKTAAKKAHTEARQRANEAVRRLQSLDDTSGNASNQLGTEEEEEEEEEEGVEGGRRQRDREEEEEGEGRDARINNLRESLEKTVNRISSWRKKQEEEKRMRQERVESIKRLDRVISTSEEKVKDLRREIQSVYQRYMLESEEAEEENEKEIDEEDEASWKRIMDQGKRQMMRIRQQIREEKMRINTAISRVEDERRMLDGKLNGIAFRVQERRGQLATLQNVRLRRLEALGNTSPGRNQGMRRDNIVEDTIRLGKILLGLPSSKDRAEVEGMASWWEGPPPTLPIVCEVELRAPEQGVSSGQVNLCGRMLGSVIPVPLQRTFVCYTNRDYEVFTREFIDRMGLRVSVMCAEFDERKEDGDRRGEGAQQNPTQSGPSDHWNPPISSSALRKDFGFDGYLGEVAEMPDVVRRILNRRVSLHAIPYALEDPQGRGGTSHRNRGPIVDREGLEQTKRFQTYFIADQRYTIQHSPYGQRLRAVAVQVLHGTDRPHIFQGPEGSMEKDWLQAIKEAEQGLKRDEEESHLLQEQISEKTKAIRSLETSLEPWRDHGEKGQKARRVRDDQGAVERMTNQLERLDLRIERDKRELSDLRQEERVDEARRLKDEKEGEELEGRGTTEARRTKERSMILEQIWRGKGGVRCRVRADVRRMGMEGLREEYIHLRLTRDQELREAFLHFQEINDRVISLKAKAKQWMDEATGPYNQLSDEEKAEMNQLTADMDLEEVKANLESERVKTQLNHRLNPDVVRSWEEREGEVQSLQKVVDEGTIQVAKLRKEMEQVRSVWERRVQSLIDHVSQGFSRALEALGAQGEVRLRRHAEGADAAEEDGSVEGWGVEILVKFRDRDPLRVLDGQRQSGGERSVATILYLLALQDLLTVPFRCVDEINQGMDPRNERKVHELLVDAACQDRVGSPGSVDQERAKEGDEPAYSQYFLITPKLLPNLKYHDRMRVLCIYSGEWIPEDQAKSATNTEGQGYPGGKDYSRHLRKRIKVE